MIMRLLGFRRQTKTTYATEQEVILLQVRIENLESLMQEHLENELEFRQTVEKAYGVMAGEIEKFKQTSRRKQRDEHTRPLSLPLEQ